VVRIHGKSNTHDELSSRFAGRDNGAADGDVGRTNP
jgi:hypothetical protein